MAGKERKKLGSIAIRERRVQNWKDHFQGTCGLRRQIPRPRDFGGLFEQSNRRPLRIVVIPSG
jgi:hypothetical protein